MTVRIGSLFSGYGGLTLGVQAVVGGTVAWHSEVDQAPSRILDARFPGVPNLGDITTVDWSAVEPVDVIEGGSPCQDVSMAGRRAGMRAGTRSGLWASMCDAIDIIRPRLVVWENVRGVLSAPADCDLEPCPWCVGGAGDGEPPMRALGRVVSDLADIGYDAAWHGLRAADVGAPHGRFRVFVAAWPAADSTDDGQPRAGLARAGGAGPQDRRRMGPAEDTDSTTRGERREPAPGQAPPGWARAHPGGRDRAHAPDADRPGRQGPQPAPRHHLSHGRAATDAAWGPYEPAIRRWERATGRPAPAPTELGAKGQPRLSPRFVEWLMGLPAGWVCDVPGLSRNDQLKALGNGVVPQQAAAAVLTLLAATAGAAA